MNPISVKVRGLEEFQKYIGNISRRLRGVVTVGVAEWLIGNSSRGLRHYIGYKYVTRKAAYGKTFKSDAQRRYVMSQIRAGKITPGKSNRTFKLQRGWEIQGEGVKTKIINTTDYSIYVLGDDTQSAHEAKVGWRTVAAIISMNIDGAIRHANAKIAELINGK